MTREKEERKKREASEEGEERRGTDVGMEGETAMRRNRTGGCVGGREGGEKRGCERVWVKMHPQHICKSLAVGYGGGERVGVGGGVTREGGMDGGGLGRKKP